MATPQRPPRNRLITGGAGPDLPAGPSHNVEPHPQACDESAEHQEAGPRHQRRAINPRSQDAGLGYCLTHTWTTPAKASRTAARTKHRPTEAAWAIWSGSNSGLSVEILMLPGVHPSRGRVEYFWISASRVLMADDQLPFELVCSLRGLSSYTFVLDGHLGRVSLPVAAGQEHLRPVTAPISIAVSAEAARRSQAGVLAHGAPTVARSHPVKTTR